MKVKVDTCWCKSNCYKLACKYCSKKVLQVEGSSVGHGKCINYIYFEGQDIRFEDE